MPNPRLIALRGSLLVAALCACQCGSTRSPAAEPTPYPPGAWRYAPTALNDVSIPLAHILIAERGASIRSELFAPRVVQRSPAEAARRALELRARAVAEPERFFALAREHSDDDNSRSRGGRLGVVPASSLPPSWLDALAALRPSEVSRPVKSAGGYHILMRLPLPAEQALAASEITIGYRGAEQPVTGFRRAVERSRQQAHTLAERLRTELARDPESFARLARECSDAASGKRGGDLGVGSFASGLWPFYWLGEIAEGQVSAVQESASGFHLYRRLPPRPRIEYAASLIVLPHDRVEGHPANAPTFAHAQAEALALAAELARTPERFDALRRAHCKSAWCAEPLAAWSEGRGEVELERALSQLPLGGITRQPLDTRLGLMLARRDDPAGRRAPARARGYEMPQPKPVGLEDAIGQLDADVVEQGAQLLGSHAERFLDFDDEGQRTRFLELLHDLARSFRDATPEVKRAALARTDRELQELLGQRRFGQFARLRYEWFASMQKFGAL